MRKCELRQNRLLQCLYSRNIIKIVFCLQDFVNLKEKHPYSLAVQRFGYFQMLTSRKISGEQNQKRSYE